MGGAPDLMFPSAPRRNPSEGSFSEACGRVCPCFHPLRGGIPPKVRGSLWSWARPRVSIRSEAESLRRRWWNHSTYATQGFHPLRGGIPPKATTAALDKFMKSRFPSAPRRNPSEGRRASSRSGRRTVSIRSEAESLRRRPRRRCRIPTPAVSIRSEAESLRRANASLRYSDWLQFPSAPRRNPSEGSMTLASTANREFPSAPRRNPSEGS